MYTWHRSVICMSISDKRSLTDQDHNEPINKRTQVKKYSKKKLPKLDFWAGKIVCIVYYVNKATPMSQNPRRLVEHPLYKVDKI